MERLGLLGFGLFYFHGAAHGLPVAGVGAHEGVVSFFLGGAEVDGDGFFWVDDWDDYLDAFHEWGVVEVSGFGVGEHFEGCFADFFVGVWVDDYEVVLHDVFVVEGEGDGFAGFDFD